jgi:hypothetical protein
MNKFPFFRVLVDEHEMYVSLAQVVSITPPADHTEKCIVHLSDGRKLELTFFEWDELRRNSKDHILGLPEGRGW